MKHVVVQDVTVDAEITKKIVALCNEGTMDGQHRAVLDK